MSSNCPPQLHLTLPANTTSFKRSFEQFGFDLESPVGGSEAGTGSSSSRRNTGGSSLNGNERNKRARSASSLSDGNDSLRSSRSSTYTSGSSDTSVSEDNDPRPGPSGLSATRPATMTAIPAANIERSFDPPRLPTPDLPDIQDIEMPDYQLESDTDQPPTEELPTTQTSSPIGNHRLSLSRFSSFDSHIDILRRSRLPSLHRSPTPPPTLPPLSLTEDSRPQVMFLPSSALPATTPGLFDSGIPASSSSSPQQRPSDSSPDDTLTDEHDSPPRLPSPVHHSPPSLTTPLLSTSASYPPVINLDVEESTSRDEDPDYVSFRERLNNAVELLETDDLRSFRERLSSALDAVRPASANRHSGNSQDARERSAPSQFTTLTSAPSLSRSSSGHSSSTPNSILQRNGSDSSGSWRPSLMNPSASSSSMGARPSRLRDLFGATSSSGSSTLRLLGTQEARSGSSTPALYIPSLSTPTLDFNEGTLREDDLTSVADHEDISDDNEISSTAANSSSSSRTARPASSLFSHWPPPPSQLSHPGPPRSSHQTSANPSSQSRPTQSLLRRQSTQSTVSNNSPSPFYFDIDFERDFSTWFSPSRAERNEGIASEQALDEDEDLDGWRYLSRNEVRRRNRPLTLPPFTPLSTTNLGGRSLPTATTASVSGLADRLGYNEDLINTMSSARDGAESNAAAPASTTSNAATAGSTSSVSSTRAPPSLSSLIARDSMDSPDDDTDDTSEQDMDVDVEPWNTRGEIPFERPPNALSWTERHEARERFLDNARRRYFEREVLGREATEGREERRDGNEGNGSANTGYRLTAHEDDSRQSSSAPTPLRWQLRWNEALEQSLDFSFVDEDEDSDAGRELSESERIWRVSRRLGRGLRNATGSNSSLVAENGSRAGSTARSQPTEPDQRWRSLPGGEPQVGPSNGLAYRRARSRISGSTRPGASNSLMAENAAELRRQSAHADLMDHLGSHGHPYSSDSTSRDFNHLRPTFSLGRRPDAPRNDALYTHPSPASSPVLPPLPYRSLPYSSPEIPHSFTETFLENLRERERELQEQRAREQSPQRPSRRSTSLSWLPPTQNSSSSGSSYLPAPTSSSLGLDAMDAIEDDRRRSRLPSWAAEHALRSSSRSPSRNTRPEPAPRHTHSSSWSSFTRARNVPESAAFLDSQRTTISDMARTITDNDNESLRNSEIRFAALLVAPSELGAPANRRTTAASASSRSVPHPNSQSQRFTATRQYNIPPFIPPPDLGDMMLVPESLSSNLSGPESPNSFETERMTPAGYGLFRPDDDLSRSRDARPSSPTPRPAPQVRQPSSGPANDTSGGASGRYNHIDVDSFAPGPFRNTMRRLIDQERSRNVPSEPPLIPPLAFEDTFYVAPRSSRTADSLDSYNARTANQHRNETNGPPTTSMINRDFGRRGPPSAPLNRSTPPRYAQRLRSPERESDSNRRRPDDLHRLMTSRARLEASLLDGSLPSSGEAAPSHSDLAGLNHAIEVLRPDGLSEARSHQLINRFRETRNANNALNSSTSLWGNLESDSNTNNNRPFRYPTTAWYRRLSDNALNATASSTATDTRAGVTATRRRPSPARGLDRSETMHEHRSSSIGRGRLSAARSRHRLPESNSLGERDLPLNDLLGPFARFRRGRGNFSLGDFMRDEDFDTSYEGLISLEATLGEVKPRSTPDHVVASLEAGFFKDWATEDSDQRCPICLDDYKALDPVLKLNDCSHWLHKSCLEQWLKGASTCPVCRKAVKGVQPHRHPRLRPQPRPSLNINTEAGPSRVGNAGRSNTGSAPSSGNSNNAEAGDNSGTNTNGNNNNAGTSNSSSTGRRTRPHFMLRRPSPP